MNVIVLHNKILSQVSFILMSYTCGSSAKTRVCVNVRRTDFIPPLKCRHDTRSLLKCFFKNDLDYGNKVKAEIRKKNCPRMPLNIRMAI